MTMRAFSIAMVALVGIAAGEAHAQQSASAPPVRRVSTEWQDSGTVHAVVWTPEGATRQLPTLIFSPGFGQSASSYSMLLSAWARQGYVVVAIEHPHFSNPDSIEFDDAARVISRHLRRAINHIVQERSPSTSPFANVDTERLGVVGHSMGGSAAAQVCAWETRARACLDLDGTIFGEVVHTGMSQPFFLLQQRIHLSPGDRPRFLEGHDQGTLHEDSVYAHAKTMYWLIVDGLDHMSFTDAALTPSLGERVQTGVGLRISAARAQEITTHYVLDFFGHYLSRTPRPRSLDATPFEGTALKRKG